ncbi:MAG: twin-arginine translocase TatA/TatE family subunit [Dermatophilaceae bacterium]
MIMDWSEWVVVFVLIMVIIGPQRMPEYAAKLARGIRQFRVMADGAKAQLKEQMGPEFDEINWRQYDPRLYDPRKIVRDALREPIQEAWGPVGAELESVRTSTRELTRGDSLTGHLPPDDDHHTDADYATPMRDAADDGAPGWHTPYDLEAT